MSGYAASAAELRLDIFSALHKLKGSRLGILLEGDVPTASLFLSALDSGSDPVAVLYRPRGGMVDSYRNSRKIIRTLGSGETHLLDIEYFSNETPFVAIAEAVRREGIDYLVCANGVEGHFATQKRFRLYAHPKEVFDAFRGSFFEYKRDASGGLRFAELLRGYRVEAVFPFLSPKVREVCGRYGWSHLNRPRPYELLRRAFPEIDGVGL